MASLLELQDLYLESLTREITEKTKSGGLEWTNLGGTQFKASETADGVTWDIFVTKTQIGNATYKYNLDIKKDNVAYVNMADGPLPYTSRSSVVKELYEIVELIVLQMDLKLKEAIRFVQQISDFRS
jgi:hypothetical protein